jgi:S1-C subfamily serine protease
MHSPAHGEGPSDLTRSTRLDDRADDRADDRVDGRADGHVDGRADGHVDGRADGHVDDGVGGATFPTVPPPGAPTPPPAAPPTARTAPPSAPAAPVGLGWRGLLIAMLAGLLGAAAVVVPVQLLDDGGPSATAPVAGDVALDAPPAADRGVAAPTTGDLAVRGVTAIARQVSPSVARVDAQGPLGAGSGSAVVYQSDGVLITNAHVVDGAAQVAVTLPDGERRDAEVIGVDAASDLAVLRVDASNLPVPVWADADATPSVGDPVVAIGSPFGLDGSVTSGIVSALGRTVTPAQGVALVDLIQTDAAINPGNSGGALVDAAGRIIGINTAIATSGGGSQGVGFAIPATTATSVAEQLLADGVVRRAELGIAGQTVDADTATLYGLPVTAGAVVVDVRPDSPADRAGLQQGDIITAIDDEPVSSVAELVGRIQQRRPGDEVTLQVARPGTDERTVTVTLGEAVAVPSPTADG